MGFILMGHQLVSMIENMLLSTLITNCQTDISSLDCSAHICPRNIGLEFEFVINSSTNLFE